MALSSQELIIAQIVKGLFQIVIIPFRSCVLFSHTSPQGFLGYFVQ